MKGILLLIFLVLSLWKSKAEEFILDCSYMSSDSTYKSYGYENLYECGAYNLKHLIGEIKVDKASGTHLKDETTKIDKTEADVEYVFIDGATKLTKIPLNITNVFTNLKILAIIYSNIAEIKEADLKPFDKLKIIILRESKIATINSDLFKNHQSIEGIDLSENLISHIDPDTFNNLKSLKVLQLQSNLCSNIKDPAKTQNEVNNLVAVIKKDGCAPKEVTTTTQTSTTTETTVKTTQKTIVETTPKTIVETTPKTAVETTENQKDVQIREQSQKIDELSKQINSSDDDEQIFVIINQQVSQDNLKN